MSTDIKIGDVEVVENVRSSIKDAQLQELMASIKQHGLQHNIGVSSTESGKYVLIYGHRRLEACRKLGWKTIPARIVEDMELKDLIIQNMVENLQRKEGSPIDFGRQCFKLQKEFKMTPGEIAVALAVPFSRVRTMMDIYKQVPTHVRGKIAFVGQNNSARAGKISVNVARKILDIKRSIGLNASQVDGLLEVARVNELSGEDIRVIGRMIMLGATPAKAVKEAKGYACYRLDVVVSVAEMDVLVKKHNTHVNTILTRILYGELPGITRPNFLSKNVKGGSS